MSTWLNSWESISQPANSAHLLILPFSVSVFPLYAHTRLIEDNFLMLRRQSGTLSLTKSGYPTPIHPSDHHLKLLFFSSPTDYVCACMCGREREKERGRESEREKGWERELVFYRKVWFFSTCFVSCNGPCAPKEKWHKKEHIIIISSLKEKKKGGGGVLYWLTFTDLISYYWSNMHQTCTVHPGVTNAVDMVLTTHNL